MGAKNINSFIVIDFETGGLSCNKNPVCEVAAVAFKGDTLAKIDLVSNFIKPYSNELVYEPEAMKYTGITFEDLETGFDLKETCDAILELCTKSDFSPRNKGSKPIFVAHNAAFDKGFLIQMFTYAKKMDDLQKVCYGAKDFYGNWQPEFIDTIHWGKAAFGNDSDIPNFKLGTCIEKAGFELPDAHKAVNDTLATKDMLVSFFNKLRQEAGQDKEIGEVNNFRKHFAF